MVAFKEGPHYIGCYIEFFVGILFIAIPKPGVSSSEGAGFTSREQPLVRGTYGRGPLDLASLEALGSLSQSLGILRQSLGSPYLWVVLL